MFDLVLSAERCSIGDMRKLSHVLHGAVASVVALLAIFTSACSSPQPFTVTIESEVINASVDSSQYEPMFYVTTNLPQGTELTFTLEGPGGYTGQDTETISKGGTAISDYFTMQGNPLRSGAYTLTVSMSIARLQPTSVQKVIGAKGEMLQGPLVQVDSFGSGNWVSAEFHYTF